jgi:glycosyltransferase involved in cell wall biosynthesis
MVGQLHDRKNPFAAIEAFGYLKDNYLKDFEGAELHLKTNTPGLHPLMEQRYPKLRIHYASWPEDIVKKFYHAQHVLLAPSKGEGKNLPALEFQTTGGAVIATNFGGHTEWISKDYAYPVGYELKAFDKKYPKSLSARINVAELQDTMMHVYQNRDEVRQKAELASEIIPKMCNWDSVMQKFFRVVKENVPVEGEKLWLKFHSLQGSGNIHD